MTEVGVGSYVKIQGLGKEELNGRIGFIQGENQGTGRFNVSLLEGRILALKKENLVKCDQPGAMAIGQDMFMRLKSDVKEKGFKQVVIDESRSALDGINKVLPAGVDASQVLVGGLLFFFISVYFLGFLKAFLLVNVSVSFLMYFYPGFKQGGVKQGFKSLGSGFRNSIQQSFGFQISENQAYAALAAFAAVSLYVIFLSGGSGGSNLQFSSSSGSDPYSKYRSSVQSKNDLLQAYRAGFQDASKGVDNFDEFYAIFTSKEQVDQEKEVEIQDDLDRVVVEDRPTKSFFSLDRLIPLMFAGKLVYDLGGGREWNHERAWANFQTQPLWKKALIGFALVRLVM